jgi:hypothetical protein
MVYRLVVDGSGTIEKGSRLDRPVLVCAEVIDTPDKTAGGIQRDTLRLRVEVGTYKVENVYPIDVTCEGVTLQRDSIVGVDDSGRRGDTDKLPPVEQVRLAIFDGEVEHERLLTG